MLGCSPGDRSSLVGSCFDRLGDQPSRFRRSASWPAADSYIRYPLPLEGISLANHKRKEVANRVAKIHGHVHAVKDMLEGGRSYSDVVHQIVAIRRSEEH